MSLVNLCQYVFFLLIVFALVKPLGGYMARVLRGADGVRPHPAPA